MSRRKRKKELAEMQEQYQRQRGELFARRVAEGCDVWQFATRCAATEWYINHLGGWIYQDPEGRIFWFN